MAINFQDELDYSMIDPHFRFVPKEDFRFDKTLFRGLEILGQVDKKFIAVNAIHNGKPLMILFDQVNSFLPKLRSLHRSL